MSLATFKPGFYYVGYEDADALTVDTLLTYCDFYSAKAACKEHQSVYKVTWVGSFYCIKKVTSAD